MRPPDDSLSELEFVAFDLETTGLTAACRIVEFGAVRFRLDGTELGRMSQLVHPGCAIPYHAWRVHRIADEMVRDQPSVVDVLPRFLEFLGDERTVLLAHNASFDLRFLRAALSQCRMPMPRHAVVDHLGFARRRLPELPSHRLGSLAASLRLADVTEHRGLADSLLLKAVFLNLMSRPPAVPSLSELHRLAPPMRFVEPPPVLVRPSAENGDQSADHNPPAAATETLSPESLSDHLRQAIRRGRPITMVYEGGSKGLAQRTVTPRALRRRRGDMFLVAFCHADRLEKSYRVDRIRQVRVDSV